MINILWVDDQKNVVMTFSHLLTPLNADIEYAIDGETAFELLQTKSYDIALLDLSMPPGKWGGIWLLEKIKENKIDLPIIIVSGEGTQDETIKAMRLGANDYVTKDRFDDELLERVKDTINQALNNNKVNALKKINQGESDKIEFKSTLRWNIHAKRNDAAMELSVIKTIAAFLNTSGGTLFIGVSDNGNILGLDLDNFQDIDKFQLHFWNKFRDMIGIENSKYIKAKSIEIDDLSIFRIDCEPCNMPVIVKHDKREIFYIRTGPRTEELNLSQSIKYIKEHFK